MSLFEYCLPAAEPRRGEDEPVHHLGMGEGEVDRDAAPARKADQGGTPDVESAEEGAQILVMLEGRVRRPGLAIATQVVADNPVLLRERKELRVPHTPVEVPGVEQDDDRPAACGVVEEVGTVDDGRASIDLRRGCAVARQTAFSALVARSTARLRAGPERQPDANGTPPRHWSPIPVEDS